MKTLYTTRAVSAGGRGGSVHVEESNLSFKLDLPPALGGKGDGANPEQLFAAGYAACFGSAVGHVLRVQKHSAQLESVAVEVRIGTEDDGYKLAAAIHIVLSGTDQKTADAIVQEAHQVCPYSKATRGNIEDRKSVV